jgi:hypothetical protein
LLKRTIGVFLGMGVIGISQFVQSFVSSNTLDKSSLKLFLVWLSLSSGFGLVLLSPISALLLRAKVDYDSQNLELHNIDLIRANARKYIQIGSVVSSVIILVRIDSFELFLALALFLSLYLQYQLVDQRTTMVATSQWGKYSFSLIIEGLMKGNLVFFSAINSSLMMIILMNLLSSATVFLMFRYQIGFNSVEANRFPKQISFFSQYYVLFSAGFLVQFFSSLSPFFLLVANKSDNFVSEYVILISVLRLPIAILAPFLMILNPLFRRSVLKRDFKNFRTTLIGYFLFEIFILFSFVSFLVNWNSISSRFSLDVQILSSVSYGFSKDEFPFVQIAIFVFVLLLLDLAISLLAMLPEIFSYFRYAIPANAPLMFVIIYISDNVLTFLSLQVILMCTNILYITYIWWRFRFKIDLKSSI